MPQLFKFANTLLAILLTTNAFTHFKEKMTLQFPNPITQLSTQSYRLATTLESGEVKFWRMSYGDIGSEQLRASYNKSGAVLVSTDEDGLLSFWSTEKKERKLYEIEAHQARISDLSFDANLRQLATASEDRTIKIWDYRNRKLLKTIYTTAPVTSITYSPNGHYLLCSDKNKKLLLYDVRGVKQEVLYENQYQETLLDVQFDFTAQKIAVLLPSKLLLLDANKNLLLQELSDTNAIKAVHFHPTHDYLFTGHADGSVKLWSLLSYKVEESLPVHQGAVKALSSIYDSQTERFFVVSGGGDQKVVVNEVMGLAPNYQKIIDQYVNSAIQKWAAKKELETDDEFAIRVTEQNYQRKLAAIRQESVNRYAMTINKLGDYSVREQIEKEYNLSVKFAQKEFFFQVPNEDDLLLLLKNQQRLDFSNHKYELHKDNSFSLKGLAIKAPKTKTYNSLERDSSNKLSSLKPLLIPSLEVSIKTAQKQDKLKKSLKKITQQLKKENKISNNIATEVKTQAVVEVNEKGEKETNLHIEYAYEVIKASINEQTSDFPPGQYRLASSKAALNILHVFKETVDNELSEFLYKGCRVTIKITGSTDASPIARKIPYDGKYGNFDDEIYFANGAMESMTVNPITGVTTNNQLAFLRTQGVRDFMQNYIESLANTQTKYQHYTHVSDKKGSEFRRIGIEMIVHDTFKSKKEIAEKVAEQEQQNLVEVDTDIPLNKEKKLRFALVIGNEDYSSFQTGLDEEVNVDYAVNDAAVFAKYAAKTLGVPRKNITLLKNATLGQMKQAVTKLSKIVKATKSQAEIFFYYSGHGLPDSQTGEAYLMPVDITGTNITSALKLHDLYQTLNEHKPKRATLFLDACFSGGARNKPLLSLKGAKVKPKKQALTGNMVVFSSSSGSETSTVYKEKQHGTFTYFLLKKLQESKANISYTDLNSYLQEKVNLESILVNDKEQNPQLNSSLELAEEFKSWQLYE